MRSAIRLMVVGVLASSVSLVPALAGEVTGNGMKSDYSQGRSFCKFSGLNDIPGGDPTQGPAGRTQSFGQENRLGLVDPTSLDPHSDEMQAHPGWFCNPNNFDASEF